MASKVTPQMCKYCFDVIVNKIKKINPPTPPFDPNLECGGMFVTWEIKKMLGYELRGCIGCLSSLKLGQMERYAKLAAFEDPRFSGITESEISKLQCTVSILHTYEKAANVYDWEVGTHGISIDFKESRHYSATFLPEVAEEQKWTKEQTIKALINKAGYNREITKKLLDSIETERYQSARLTLTYDEYTKL